MGRAGRGAERRAVLRMRALTTAALVAGAAAQADVDSCPGGQGVVRNATYLAGVCERCPDGKQSPAGEPLCVYCRDTLTPSAGRDGCECAPLHFSAWGATANLTDVGCTACAALHVTRLSDMREMGAADSNVAAVGSLLGFEREGGTQDDFAVPCKGPSAGVQEFLRDKGDIDVVKSLCDTFDHTECQGGQKGAAQLCTNTGVWMLPGPVLAIEKNLTLLPPDRTSEQAGMFFLQECMPPRGGGPSRCQHWSRCVKGADTGTSTDDPWFPYVSDEEFAAWLVDPANAGKNCATELRAFTPRDEWGEPVPASREALKNDPWAHVRSDGVNCCAPDYEGMMCDECIEPLMKINEKCVFCAQGGNFAIDWQKMFVGSCLAIGFTLFIMHKASVTFEDADGTATIAIFYFQLITLMFRDRAAHLAWPVMMDLLAVMDLGFVTNSESTCMVKLSFYQNCKYTSNGTPSQLVSREISEIWRVCVVFPDYFNIVSTMLIIGVVYTTIIFVTSLTATKQETKQAHIEAGVIAKNFKIAQHILSHVHVFEVSKNHDFCIKNKELCIKNKEFCIQNDEFCRAWSRRISMRLLK